MIRCLMPSCAGKAHAAPARHSLPTACGAMRSTAAMKPRRRSAMPKVGRCFARNVSCDEPQRPYNHKDFGASGFARLLACVQPVAQKQSRTKQRKPHAAAANTAVQQDALGKKRQRELPLTMPVPRCQVSSAHLHMVRGRVALQAMSPWEGRDQAVRMGFFLGCACMHSSHICSMRRRNILLTMLPPRSAVGHRATIAEDIPHAAQLFLRGCYWAEPSCRVGAMIRSSQGWCL